MATGYKIFLPNGSLQNVTASNLEQKFQICDRLIRRWQQYCHRNWIGNASRPYSPENKVKGFLNGLGTFLVTGSGGETGWIISRYKDIANGKRQIPVSSCPSYIEECVYGMIHTGNKMDVIGKEQSRSFDEYMEFIDAKAESSYKSLGKKKPKNSKKRRQTKSERMAKAFREGITSIQLCVVDTEGMFADSNGTKYVIDLDKCKSYAPKELKNGDVIYDMDSIYRAVMADGAIRFFDQSYHPVQNEYIKQNH